MIYDLAYPKFSPSVSAALDAFRIENEPDRARIMPPHITLVFGLDAVEPRGIIATCRRVGAETARFQISLQNFAIIDDPVENTCKICLMCGEGKGRVVSLHRALYDGPQRRQLRTDIPYEPHMTIATNKDRKALEKADPTLIGDFLLRAEIGKIDVVRLTSGTLRSLEVAALRR